MNMFKKIFAVLSVFTAITSSAAYAEQNLKETDAQQFAREEIKRRRNDLKNVIESRRNELKERTKQTLNERIQERLVRSIDKINEINQRKTTQYLNFIGRIESISEKIEERIDVISERGVDVGEARNRLQNVNNSISEVRNKIMRQSKIVYNATGESLNRENISAEIKGIRENLRGDLKSIRDQIWQTRKELMEVISFLDNIVSENQNNN